MDGSVFKTMLVLIVVVFFVSGFVGYKAGETHYQSEAIKAGAAKYNPTNANFEWKTNLTFGTK